MSLSSIEQGEIVVADVLYSDMVGVKRRLALVLSSTTYNRNALDLIAAKITSHGSSTDYDVPLSN